MTNGLIISCLVGLVNVSFYIFSCFGNNVLVDISERFDL